ncbi:GNAT family N-acetyltransferase [Paenibacillus physcomitrellae]|uniref:Acetyltransferase n=1 Tax=Paenibacillus physcomitrellae TaxID=1619311 RepID=A0ABQ1FLN5_9BACL|nr:GNAT family N-acetyltransferase [Paenibacillus physcomitrellae]GGA21461.1 putative acetyltransferase [Paenibacillus physcomitrellae]
MAAVIIPVKSEDRLQNCLDIRREVFVEEQKVPISLEIDEFDHIADDAHHLLIEQDGNYAATGRITYYKDNAAKIQRVAVRKAFRSKGIGKVLMIGLEELARELGFEKAVLDGQLHAVPFYEKLGYVVTSEEPFDDAGILHHRMEKKL